MSSSHPVVNRVIHAPHLSVASDEYKARIYAEASKQADSDDGRIQIARALNIEHEKASFLTKGKRFIKELNEWNKAGRPLAPAPLRRARLKVCNSCTLFKKGGNFFLGECTAPGCGCTKAKAFLLTSKCPYPGGSKWPDPKLY